MIDNPSAGGSATPTPTPPATGNPATGGATPPAATLTLEEALKRIADLEHSKELAISERDHHRKKLTAFEKAEAEREQAKKEADQAQLSEIDRVKQQYAELEAQYVAVEEARIQQQAINDLYQEAAKLGIKYPDAAVRLLDWDEIDSDDDGNFIGIDKGLEKLIQAYPFLTEEKPAPTQPQARFAPRTPAMSPERTSIAVPGTAAPGRIPRLDDPGLWKK